MGRRIRKALERGDLVLGLCRHRHHLIPQAQVHRQVRAQAPVILNVSPKEALPEPPRCNRADLSAETAGRGIGEEGFQRPVTEAAGGTVAKQIVRFQAIKGEAEFQ